MLPSRTIRFLACLLCTSAVAGFARAAAALEQLHFSPDIAVNLQDQSVDDEDVAADDLAGTISLADLGVLPAASAIGAYHALGGDRHLLVFETTTNLPGGVVARPRDVVRFDGADYALLLNGETLGIPANARIDALSLTDEGAYLLSFDVTVTLDGVTVEDADLVETDGTSVSLFLDGSGVGIPAGLDLDAAHLMPGSRTLLLSFDGSGTTGGVLHFDEDLIEYDAEADAWRLAFDGSARHAGLAAADLDAVYAVALLGEIIFVDGFE